MRPISRLTLSIAPALLCLFLCALTIGLPAEQAEARAGGGGRSFSSSRSASPRGNFASPRSNPSPNQFARPAAPPPSNSGGFMRGLAGGLVGGALGSMLFGGLAHGGMGGGIGGGIGLFQLLILGGIGYFVYVKFFKNRNSFSNQQRSEYDHVTPFNQYQNSSPGDQGYDMPPPPPSLEDGLEAIRRSEPDFDPLRFKEVASEVFFKIQAGWMRREIEAIGHLLDPQLASEYSKTFAEMKNKGVRNRLENITVRNVEIVDAGVEGTEEFITLLFTANLLDYTEEEASGRIVSGSNTEPVKFAEQWTWSRPLGSQNWKLAGIKE